MIKTTITRKFKDGKLIEEIEIIEDDTNHVSIAPIFPKPPTITPWWKQPWAITWTTESTITDISLYSLYTDVTYPPAAMAYTTHHTNSVGQG